MNNKLWGQLLKGFTLTQNVDGKEINITHDGEKFTIKVHDYPNMRTFIMEQKSEELPSTKDILKEAEKSWEEIFSPNEPLF